MFLISAIFPKASRRVLPENMCYTTYTWILALGYLHLDTLVIVKGDFQVIVTGDFMCDSHRRFPSEVTGDFMCDSHRRFPRESHRRFLL